VASLVDERHEVDDDVRRERSKGVQMLSEAGEVAVKVLHGGRKL
jgi:hypothetical protein